MTDTFYKILDLIQKDQALVSSHGYDEMAEESIFVSEVVAGVSEAIVIEDYPSYSKGPCILLLQKDTNGRPIHVVWGIPRGLESPAVIVTAYRPDPSLWSEGFTRRKI
jgi:hypothetical protein